MEIQENTPLPKNVEFFSKKEDTQEKPTFQSNAYIKCIREKFRSEGRKSDIQLKFEQKRFSFLNDGVFKKYEDEIVKFFDGFSQTKTQPKIVIKRLLENFEKAEKSGEENAVFENLKILRKITCIPKTEPILQEILLSKIMNFLDVYFDLNFVQQDKIENEILWIYINLTTLPQKTNNIFDFSGFINKILLKMAKTRDEGKLEMIFWLFYNLSVDNIDYKKKLLAGGVVDLILSVWKENFRSTTFTQNLIELVLALAQKKSVYSLYASEILKLFPIIESCFQENMLDANILWILKNLSDFDNNVLNKIIAMDNFDRILKNLLSNDINIAQVSLKIINNCLSGDGRIVQFLIEKNILEIFTQLIQNEHLSIRQNVCFGISNMCVGSPHQINILFGSDLLNEMIKLAFIDDISVKLEVGIGLANLAFFADKKQKINLVNRGIMNIWEDILSQYHFYEESTIVRILEGLEQMLFLGREIESVIGVNSIKVCVENTSIPQFLDKIQDHPNEKIYKICFNILDQFFNSMECD